MGRPSGDPALPVHTLRKVRRLEFAALFGLGAGIALNVAANIFSAVSHRPLMMDGSAWFFKNLAQGWFTGPDTPGDRYFNSIWQVPTVLLVHLAGMRDWLRLELLSFELSYSLHPFLSLGFSAWICRRARVPWMFLFPLASYATATNPAHGFAPSEIASTLTVFWPLFLVVLLRPFLPERNSIAIVLLSLALAFTHSWAFPLFLILIVPTLAPYWDRARLPRRWDVLLAALFLAGALWNAYMGAVVNRRLASTFLFTWSESWGAITRIMIPSSMAFAALAAWRGPTTARGRLCLWAALGAASIGACWYLGSALADNPLKARANFLSFFARIPAVPVAGLLALSLFFIHTRLPQSAWREERRWRMPAAWLTMLLILGAVNSAGQTLSWRASMNYLRAVMDRDPRPCIVMSKADYRKWFIERGNWAYGLPIISMVIQGTREPRQVVAQEVVGGDRKDFCANVARGRVYWPFGWYDDLNHNQHLTLDRIREAIALGHQKTR